MGREDPASDPRDAQAPLTSMGNRAVTDCRHRRHCLARLPSTAWIGTSQRSSGTPAEGSQGLHTDEQRIGQIIFDSYNEYRADARNWSAVYFGCLFFSAACAALAGVVIKLEFFLKNEGFKKDLAAVLAMLSALLVTLSTRRRLPPTLVGESPGSGEDGKVGLCVHNRRLDRQEGHPRRPSRPRSRRSAMRETKRSFRATAARPSHPRPSE